MAQYNLSENRRNDEFTATYKNLVLGRIVASEPDAQLLYITSKAITTKETNEVLLAIEPMVRQGSEVYPMNTLFSRNTLTPADVDRLQNFVATEAIVRIGTFIGPDGKKESKNPSVIALLDANGAVFQPSGAKRQPKAEWLEDAE